MAVNKENTCVCGIVADRNVGTITRIFEGKEITLHNVPHFPCLVCEEITFDDETSVRIEQLVKEAIANNVSEIDM